MEDRKVSIDDVQAQIENCWIIISDLRMLLNNKSSHQDFYALYRLYSLKFEQLWGLFEEFKSTYKEVEHDRILSILDEAAKKRYE